MADTKVPPISIQVPLVDPETGCPTPYFQRLLQILLEEKNITADQADENVTDIQDLADTVSNLEMDDLSDVDITANAQGDILYRAAGSEWKNLPPGTSGKFLKTQGAAANPIWSSLTSSAVGCTVTKSTQTIANNDFTTASDISFDTEVKDDDNFWSIGTPTRLIAGTSGWHLITASHTWASNATGNRWLRIYKNTTLTFSETYQPGTAIQEATLSALIYLTAGDYMKMQAAQTATGAVSLASTSNTFSMVRL